MGDNAELVENNLRHNPETKGWRLTLRLKVKDPSKSTELRAALVKDEDPAPVAPLTKAEKAAAKAQEKKEQLKAKDAKAPAAEAAPATPAPVKTEKVLTETWSYQLPADE